MENELESPTPLLSDFEEPTATSSNNTNNVGQTMDINPQQQQSQQQQSHNVHNNAYSYHPQQQQQAPAQYSETPAYGGGGGNFSTSVPAASNNDQNNNNDDGFPTVEVVAPATLQKDYTFDVMVGGRVLSVTVPPGGVTEGQLFQSKTKAPAEDSQEILRIPQGFWKDGFFDVMRFGPLHPSIFLATFCPMISLGQIISRLGLTWNAKPAQDEKQTIYTFYIFVFLSLFGFSLLPWWLPILILTFISGQIRRYIRERYDIPPTMAKVIPNDNSIPGCRFSDEYYDVEDYALSCCCMPCTVSQMNRHTAVYETYQGTYTTHTGLPKHVPIMV